MSGPARLALDLQALQIEGFANRGIGRYAGDLAQALAEQGRVAAALLAPELPPASHLPAGLVAGGLVAWDGAASVRRLLAAGGGPLVHHVLAPLVHVGAADPPGMVAGEHWARAGCHRAVTLYDLIPLRAPSHYLAAPGAIERYRSRAAWVGASDLILTISEHTRSEALELLGADPDRVVTVGAGVSSWWTPADGTDDALFASVLGRWVARPFLLCVTGSDARKNTERLVEAVGLLARRGCGAGLVVAGHLTPPWTDRLAAAANLPPRGTDRLAGPAAAAGVADRVELIGAVDDGVLRACYRRAVLTVMPSLAEGSGLPVLESAACGTPAAASATTALREVAASPLATFDPTDATSIAAVVTRLVDDRAVRSEVASLQAALAAASSWDVVASRVVDAVDALVGRRPPRRPVATRRLQVLLDGPVVPEGGGIGAYNTRLVAAGTDLDWTVVSDRPLPPAITGARRAHPDLVGADVRPASFDAVIHTLGNSAGHLDRLPLVLRHPGWLWLHEVRLPALVTTALDHLDDGRFNAAMDRLLRRAYPGRVPAGAARRAGRSDVALAEAGIGLAGLLAARSTGVLVNSQAARHLLVVDLPPGVAVPPITVLPPMCPPVDPAAAPRPGGDAGIVAFGIVSMPKQPDVLVDAAALLGCPLHFVGLCPPILRQVIEERAAHRGTSGRVAVHGEVDGDGWADWMQRATLAVQLRSGSAGESSAAVLDALAAGTPVATSLLSATDLPAGVAARVRSVDAATLASDLAPLLADSGGRRRLSAAGLAFARSHRPEDLVAALVQAVAP